MQMRGNEIAEGGQNGSTQFLIGPGPQMPLLRKPLAAKPDDLRSILQTHKRRKEMALGGCLLTSLP